MQTQMQTQMEGIKEKDEEGQEGEKGGILGIVRRLWMGNEKPGWEKRRMEEDRERLSQGGVGIGDLIRERVTDVFFEGEKGKKGGKEEGVGKED